MTEAEWPDNLQAAQGVEVAALMHRFWQQLAQLPELSGRKEHLLCAECTGHLRAIVLRMMLALNGIAYPAETRHLNRYLSASQRAAIEKTLITPFVGEESWIGQAVALVVIFRWYAPQLAAAFDIPEPVADEQATLATLQAHLPDWPVAITSGAAATDPATTDPATTYPATAE